MKTLTIGENVFEIVDEQARNNIETLNNTLENMVVEETDPTVPAWAKEATKPTYTAAEVGARPDTWMPSASDVGALPDTTKIPTKTSDLANDSGFLTQHQSLADYAKKSELPTDLADLTGDSTHRTVTDAEKNTWNVKSDFSGSYNDLTNKPTIPTKTSDLSNDSGFIDAIPSEYVTETELESKGYSTFSGSYDDLADKPTIPSLDGYATETYVTGYAQPKGSYALQSDVDDLYKNKTDNGHTHFASSIDTSDILFTEFGDVTLDNLEMLLFSLDPVLANKANKGELNTLSEDIESLSGEIADKLPKNQGAGNVGKILVVGTDGNLTLTDMPEGGAGGDVVGTLDESNNILLTGNLADGTYKLKYEYADGDVEEVGSIVISSIVTYSITKTLSNCTASGATTINKDGTATITVTANSGYKLPDSITVSGASYTWDKASGKIVLSNPTGNVAITVTAVSAGPTNLADPTSADWKEGYRLSISSGSTSALAGHTVTNFIPCKAGDVLRVKGMTITGYANSNTDASNAAKIVGYNSSKAKINGIYCLSSAETSDGCADKITTNGDISTYTILMHNDGTQRATSAYAYIRIDGMLMSGYTKNDVVITINEEIA